MLYFYLNIRGDKLKIKKNVGRTLDVCIQTRKFAGHTKETRGGITEILQRYSRYIESDVIIDKALTLNKFQ